ncbi:GNAT family N-acetyltransferase [Priestia sp. Y58]|uniref:GNAT family N-acetyltransferase n=1 Tax=unclassified Priestia TaxID=2800374 RepID=UPI002407716B|nr:MULTISPECIES: GNAT family N-acetyltransferase [unclassified Priestia]MDG0032520.1 GNAT family N-acetyltransferase [Priestia sp. Y58]MDG0058310.1 GNAT family N-acetyltransferase [Priestia sp. P5]
MYIRDYKETDETEWVHCRVLSFLNTAYFDNVLRVKEKYKNSAVELVAVENKQIVGLIDVECESQKGTVCSGLESRLGGMIWHLAVHPDFRRKGIANQLLYEAENRVRKLGITYLEAWTRDDNWVNKWYLKNNFKVRTSYLHVFLERPTEIKKTISSSVHHLQPVQVFAHYTGPEKERVIREYNRVHECYCYQKKLL